MKISGVEPATLRLLAQCRNYLRHQQRAPLGGRVRTVKENAEALVVASEEIGLEVNADKTKYLVMPRDQNAGGSHSINIDN